MKNKLQVSIIRTLFNIGISGGVFAGVAYYIGRQYLQGYYQTLGIPVSMLHFDFTECIYDGVKSGIIFVAVLVALLIYNTLKVIMSFQAKTEIREQAVFTQLGFWIPTSKENFEEHFKFDWWLKSLSSIYVVFFLFLVVSSRIAPSLWRSFIQIPAICVCFIYGSLLTNDDVLISFSLWSKSLKGQQKIFRLIPLIFVASLIVVIFWAFSMPFEWGQVKGINDWATNNVTHNMASVYIFSNTQQQYVGIDWIDSGNGMFRNQNPVVLILQTDTGVIVKSVSIPSEVLFLNNQNIIAIQTVMPQ